jgi:hypothetical protein
VVTFFIHIIAIDFHALYCFWSYLFDNFFSFGFCSPHYKCKAIFISYYHLLPEYMANLHQQTSKFGPGTSHIIQLHPRLKMKQHNQLNLSLQKHCCKNMKLSKGKIGEITLLIGSYVSTFKGH